MNSVPLILSILAAGFMGSWHCAVMCGPICVTLSAKGSLWSYHLGRGLSYSLAGAISGAMGSFLSTQRSPELRWAGAFFLCGTLLWMTVHQWKGTTSAWQKWIWSQIHFHRDTSKMILGFSSVFLPCSWLYYFMAAAAATQSPWTGSLVLFLFWLSGLPALTGSSLILRQAVSQAPSRQRKVATLLITLCGMYAVVAHFIEFSL
ncbi:MAG: sulfite exporter TauE/SafE family protein [Bdellovibrionales bacterium]|nr:sulfite exporter TauE/SafE family protein [Bdellovibrionales bacterium]